MGFLMYGAFFNCSEVFAVAKKFSKKKGKKKNSKGGKGNKEEFKSPPYVISAAEGVMIRKSSSSGRLPKQV